MPPLKTLVAALLLTTSVSALAADTFQIRVPAKGVKPTVAATTPTAPVVPTAPPPPPAPPQVSLSPVDWDFGLAAANQAVTQTFTLSNTGSSEATLGFSTLTAPFSRASGTCAAKLAPKTNCDFTVTYQASLPEDVSASQLWVSLGGGAESLMADLRGATASVPGTLTPGVAGVVYSNNNTAVSRPTATEKNIPFANSKSTGKWYYEVQSSAQGSIYFLTSSGSGYYLDLYYRDRNVIGSGVSPSGSVKLTTPSTARYGFALDADARKMMIIDVATCTVMVTPTWSAPTAIRPYLGFRPYDSVSTTHTAYFAPSGKTCIPAGYKWWTGG